MIRNLLIIMLIGVFFCSCESENSVSPGSGTAGSLARFAISGDNLYTVSTNDMSVFDISNAAKPKKVRKIPISNFVETIFPKDSLIFLGTRSGMLIYDNSTPSYPKYISEYSHIYSCDPVVVSKHIAFVTLNSASSRCGRRNNRLDIIDISDLHNPKAIAEHQMFSPRGLGIDKNMLFVCDNGLKIFNIDDFHKPKLVEHFTDMAGYDVIPDNGYLLMIGEDGFSQYQYIEDKIKLLSTIPVNRY